MLKPSRCASRTRAYWSTVTILHLLAAGSVYQHTGGSCGGTVFNEDFWLGGGPGLDEDYHAKAKFKKVSIDDPASYFRGKTIRVTGVVTLKENRPHIEVDEPRQIEVVEK